MVSTAGVPHRSSGARRRTPRRGLTCREACATQCLQRVGGLASATGRLTKAREHARHGLDPEDVKRASLTGVLRSAATVLGHRRRGGRHPGRPSETGRPGRRPSPAREQPSRRAAHEPTLCRTAPRSLMGVRLPPRIGDVPSRDDPVLPRPTAEAIGSGSPRRPVLSLLKPGATPDCTPSPSPIYGTRDTPVGSE